MDSKQQKTKRIAVYGSLLSGLGNHHRMEQARGRRVGDVYWTKPDWIMVSLGSFPGIMPAPAGEGTQIAVEVYEVPIAGVLGPLDILEGHPDFYRRTPIVLADGSDVEIYVLADRRGSAEVVPHGDWRRWRAERQVAAGFGGGRY